MLPSVVEDSQSRTHFPTSRPYPSLTPSLANPRPPHFNLGQLEDLVRPNHMKITVRMLLCLFQAPTQLFHSTGFHPLCKLVHSPRLCSSLCFSASLPPSSHSPLLAPIPSADAKGGVASLGVTSGKRVSGWSWLSARGKSENQKLCHYI